MTAEEGRVASSTVNLVRDCPFVTDPAKRERAALDVLPEWWAVGPAGLTKP